MTTSETQHCTTISRSTILYGEEDAWYDLDKFYTDHIQEIYHRISTLDDEIWGKIILMEKNKRVAKAYLRIPEIIIDGSCNGFDGRRIGFCSFENPARDRSVEELRTKIGAGVVLKMDQKGNVLAKRIGATHVIVQGVERPELFCFGNEVIKLKGRLEDKQPVKVFDMKSFKNSIEQELQKPYPDRKRLMFQTLMRISLVKNEQYPLKTPCWFTIINLVALDMLVNKVPTMPTNLPDTLVFSTPSDDSLSDLQREQLLNQSSCDLYGTLTPISQFAKNQMLSYPSHWSNLAKSPSTEFMDQLSRNQMQRPPKAWKSPPGYMSEAEGTKIMQHRRGRSMEPRQVRPVSQCWSAVPSVENLTLYSNADNLPPSNGRTFSTHTLKPSGNNTNKKLCSNANNVSYYGTLKNNAWMCVSSTSDYDSSRMDIYESSNSSSNSGISGSCRPSSPSIVSEASESQTSDSGFADTEAVSSMVVVSPSTSSSKHGTGLKEKIANGTNLSNSRLPPTQRNSSELTVIEFKRESFETKEINNDQLPPTATHNDQLNKLETKPTVTSDQTQPIPPTRKRHQSLKRNERQFLPLSFVPSNLDSDDDSESTKVWSF